MRKRHFLAAAAGLPAWALAQGNAGRGLRGPALLTVTGAIGAGNRGGFDPVLDQMMGKHKLAFDKAHAFDFAALAALPAITIAPTLEYDQKPHRLSGPLLADVLGAAGAVADNGKLTLRAIDGYAPVITHGDARRLRFIVATHLDGRPMPLGGLGPLWAVFDADRVPEMAARPVNQRFAMCPWGLYHVDVQPGSAVALAG